MDYSKLTTYNFKPFCTITNLQPAFQNETAQADLNKKNQIKFTEKSFQLK